MDRLDAVIHSAEDGESNGLRGKSESSLYISTLPGLHEGFFYFFCYLRSKPGNWGHT